ncbi:uncharacterized protein CBL_07662 [Carabus blaptoides fortunei]
MPTASFCERFKIIKQIGEGAFSEVLKCKDRKTGECFAAKRLKKHFTSMQEVFESAEVIAMEKIPRHHNILLMREVHYDNSTNNILFLFELMDMSLFDFLNSKKRCIPETRAKHFLYQILSGLHHLHKNGLFHRDIKPENILLKDCNTQNEILKIGDLGSIRGLYSKHPYTEYISTRWYRSPECLLTTGYYGPKMDIWATGCVFYEMLTLKPLFAGSNELDQLSHIHNILGTPSTRLVSKYHLHKSYHCQFFSKQVGTGLCPLLTNVSLDGQTVLKMMVTYDADARSNVKRLLDHKYFACYREPSEKTVKQRASSLERPLMKPVGDYKGISKINMKKSNNDYHITKFYSTINQGSLNNLLSIANNNRSFCTKPAKATEELYFFGKGVQKPDVRCKDTKPVQERDVYRKTTSNIPHAKPPEQAHKTNNQSKSFVMPRMAKKRLEPVTEVPGEDINKNVPQKVVVLDRCNKDKCKYSGNRRREWR